MAESSEHPLFENVDQRFEATGLQRKENVGRIGGIEFKMLEPSDLTSFPVVVQALDNQWIPRSLLQSVFKASRVTENTEKKHLEIVRAEYIRSLINSQQVVLNRAYIYNNPVISQDYFSNDEQQQVAFKALLEEGAIVLHLFAERSPIDRPSSGAGTITGYYGVGEQFSRWEKLCHEVRLSCLRLSWDDKENYERVLQLSQHLNSFIINAAARDVDIYVQDFHLAPNAKNDLRKRLIELAQFGISTLTQDKVVTRNSLYREFVTAGENPSARIYGSNKLFASEIKQIIDLMYNCSLPDTIGGYLITPIDALPRLSLQEQQSLRSKEDTSTEEIVELLRRYAFDLVQKGLYFKSMASLNLWNVREIRQTDEWKSYILSLEELLNDPFQFGKGGAAKVYHHYAEIIRKVIDLGFHTKAQMLIQTDAEVDMDLMKYKLQDIQTQWTSIQILLGF